MTVSFPGRFRLRAGSAAMFGNAFKEMWSVSDELTRRLIAGSFLLTLGSSIVAAFSPLILQILVDSVDFSSSSSVEGGPVYLIVVYVFAHWLSRSLGELRGMLLGRADQRVNKQLSSKFFGHVISLPLRFHLNQQIGALSQTLTNGLLGYRSFLHHLVNSILPVLIELTTMGVILVSLGHTVFFVIIGTSVMAYAVAFWIGAMRIGVPARDVSNAHISAGAVFSDSFLNYETVKYFNGESQARVRLLAALRKTESLWARLYARKMENGVVIATIFTSSLGLSMYCAAVAVKQGSMSIGEFVLVNAYVIQLIRPLEMIGFAFRDIVQGLAFLEKMVGLLGEKREVDIARDPAPVSVGFGELAFRNVSLSYDADRLILKNVSFVAAPGETLAIVGASGSGKSSLIRLLLRLLDPSAGRISIDGISLSNIPRFTLREAVAVVPQDIALFNDSVAYNIAFGRHGSTREEIALAAKVAHIHDFILSLPNGYDTQVGERGIRLSGGEKQRIAIARAAIKRPKIFVFDEATSSLDSRTERVILENLVRTAGTAMTIIVAHRLSTVVHANEIVVLDGGSVIERGTHEALMRQGGKYATMWHAQHEEIYRKEAVFAS